MIGILTLMICSVAVSVMTALCAANIIRRNAFFGLRMPSLFASDAAWSSGHRSAVAPLTLTSILQVALTVAVYLIPGWASIGTGIGLALLLIGLGAGTLLANRTARAVERDSHGK